MTDVKVVSVGAADTENQYLMQFRSGSSPFLMTTASGIPLSINTENIIVPSVLGENTKATQSVLDNNNFNKVLTGDMLVSESTAKRAEMAAQQIYKIRESRTNYLTGEADVMPDGQALKLILAQLDEQEQTLMALFTGIVQKETAFKSFDFVPADDTNNEIVFRISVFNGIVDKTDHSCLSLYLTLNVPERGDIFVPEIGEDKKSPTTALWF